MKSIFVLAVIVLLSGCSYQNNETTSFIKADAEQAIILAQQAGDEVAAECYKALVSDLPDSSQEFTAGGVITTFERARLLRMRIGVSENVHVKCAPLIIDAERTIIGLGLRLH